MKTKENFQFARNKNNKVALYIRANEVDGVARQLFRAISFANKNGVELSPSRVYADICSGNQFPRPAFDRMLREKSDKRYKTVLITDVSRLARNPESLLMANMQLIMSGLTLKVMN